MADHNIVMKWQGVEFGFTTDAEPYQRDLVPIEQVHGDKIIRRSPKNSDTQYDADGHWTSQKNLTVGVRTADCIPLLVFIPGKLVAAIHAGWKGVDSQIQFELYRQVKEAGYDLTQAFWIVGPHICPACFEVTSPVLDSFLTEQRKSHVITTQDRTYVDLAGCLIGDLRVAGFSTPQAILTMGGCTVESSHWPSHRRDGASSDRLYGWIRLLA